MLKQQLKAPIVSTKTRGILKGKYYTSPLYCPNLFTLNTFGLQLSIENRDLGLYGDTLLLLSPVQE